MSILAPVEDGRKIVAVGKITPTSKSLIVHPTITLPAEEVNAFLEASFAPPPTRDERVDEAAYLLRREQAYRARKAHADAELADLLEARLDEEFNRTGC